MEARASSDLSFIGMWNISFIIMWPLHNQSYCNISMQNGSNVIIVNWKLTIAMPTSMFQGFKRSYEKKNNWKLGDIFSQQ